VKLLPEGQTKYANGGRRWESERVGKWAQAQAEIKSRVRGEMWLACGSNNQNGPLVTSGVTGGKERAKSGTITITRTSRSKSKIASKIKSKRKNG
jgi:hypothetical protein